MAKGKKANLFVWIILGLLIIGLAGFGLENFGGTVRSIGSVGDRSITTGDYARAFRQEIRAAEAQRGAPVSMAEAEAQGLGGRVIGQLISIAALENEADRLRLSVSDETVAREIREIAAFRSVGGSFDRETYRFVIQSQGYSEREFESRLRDEVARTILQAAVLSGVETPEAQIDLIFDHLAQRRTIDILTLTAADIDATLSEPDEDTLRAHHAARIAAFTRPATRQITYAMVTPAMLIDTVELDEASLRALYDQRIAEYVRPERRLVERLVFSSQAAAEAAAGRLASGEISFEELVTERELTLEDVDLGDVTQAALGAAGAAVFALEDTGVVGPLPSPLGPALFRVNAILNAQETPFEEAALELRDELAADRAARVIADAREGLVDLLAGGLTLEEIAAETMLELGRISWREGESEGIAAYPEFRTAAAAAATDDFAELRELSDGGVFTLRLDAVEPPTPQPFDEVREAVAADWARAETLRLMTLQAEALRATGSLPRAPEPALDLGTPAEDEAGPGEDAASQDASPDPEAPASPEPATGDAATGGDAETIEAARPDAPAIEGTASETPVETPVETPAAETPAAETPVAETPAAETPATGASAEAADTPPARPALPGDFGLGGFSLGEETDAGSAVRYADRFEALGRNAFLPGLPRSLIEVAFTLGEGEIRIVEGEGTTLHLVQLVEVLGPDTASPQVMALRGLVAQQTAQTIAQDLFAHFVTALERQAGVRLDDRAVSAVNANLR